MGGGEDPTENLSILGICEMGTVYDVLTVDHKATFRLYSPALILAHAEEQ